MTLGVGLRLHPIFLEVNMFQHRGCLIALGVSFVLWSLMVIIVGIAFGGPTQQAHGSPDEFLSADTEMSGPALSVAFQPRRQSQQQRLGEMPASHKPNISHNVYTSKNKASEAGEIITLTQEWLTPDQTRQQTNQDYWQQYQERRDQQMDIPPAYEDRLRPTPRGTVRSPEPHRCLRLHRRQSIPIGWTRWPGRWLAVSPE